MMRPLRISHRNGARYVHLTGGVTVKVLPRPRASYVCLNSRCIAGGVSSCCDHAVFVARLERLRSPPKPYADRNALPCLAPSSPRHSP